METAAAVPPRHLRRTLGSTHPTPAVDEKGQAARPFTELVIRGRRQSSAQDHGHRGPHVATSAVDDPVPRMLVLAVQDTGAAVRRRRRL